MPDPISRLQLVRDEVDKVPGLLRNGFIGEEINSRELPIFGDAFVRLHGPEASEWPISFRICESCLPPRKCLD
jgi:hypothetical protein